MKTKRTYTLLNLKTVEELTEEQRGQFNISQKGADIISALENYYSTLESNSETAEINTRFDGAISVNIVGVKE